MSTNKPTPDPWRSVPFRDASAYSIIRATGARLNIGEIYTEPDARLVTASPLMYQALEQVSKWLFEMGDIADINTLDGYDELVETIALAMSEAVEDDSEEGTQ